MILDTIYKNLKKQNSLKRPGERERPLPTIWQVYYSILLECDFYSDVGSWHNSGK